MSRTTRKFQRHSWGENTKEEVIAEAVKYYLRYPTKRLKRRKDKAVYAAEFKKAGEDFITEWNRLMKLQTIEGVEIRDYWRRHYDAPHSLRYQYYVNRFYYVTIDKVLEDEIAEAVAKFNKRTRDGYYYNTDQNTGFKQDSARAIRRKNKRLCNDIVDGIEYDTKPYPSCKEEKMRVWDWW